MSEKENKTIVFVETKRRCDDLTRKMRRDGYVATSVYLQAYPQLPEWYPMCVASTTTTFKIDLEQLQTCGLN